MRWLRVIGLGALFWLIIFVEISITMIGLGFSESTVYAIHYAIMIPLGILVAWLYYKSKDKVNGFLIGLAMVLVGVVLDLAITVPFFVIPAGGNYVTYFSSLYLWIGFLEGIVVIGIYDLMRKK